MKAVKLNFKKVFALIALFTLAVSLSILCGCAQNIPVTQDIDVSGLQHHDGYELEQMTVVSRHNIRSPLSDPESNMAKLTNHQWFKWTSNASETSLKGGIAETGMGQYFRRYLEQENFIPANWVPTGNQVYVYANSLQRTISTANYFITGMIPLANVDVNHKNEIGKVDNVFVPNINKMNDSLKAKITEEANQIAGDNGIQGAVDGLADNYRLLEDTIDYKDSRYAQETNTETMTTEESNLKLNVDKEPALTGPLRLGNDVVDPLKMQYYEVEDDKEATFGKNLSYDQMKALCQISDAYYRIIYTGHTLSTLVNHEMLEELNKDINDTSRKFTFLCGHDTTVIPTLYSLDCEAYSLPNTISTLAPIGSKIVFGKYKDAAGEEYMNVSVVYETTDQLRHKAIVDVDNPPMAYEISFKGLQKNSDGMYKLSDFQNRLNQSIADYDNY